MCKFVAILFIFVFGLVSCKQPANYTPSANAKTYDFHGKVISVDKANKKVTVAHDKIEGFMDAMTMEFPVKQDAVFEEMVPGADIRAQLVVDNTADPSYWLQNIAISVAPKDTSKLPPVKNDVATEGKQIVDFTLTDQNGKTFKPADFAGKSWALTFIYSECPLPDYCIAMSKHFSDIANSVASDPSLKEKIRLLSISFDPKRDTPEKLKSYGLGYLGNNSPDKDFVVWKLAVGKDSEVRKVADFFGLHYEVDESDQTQFTHSLRTAVIAPDGKVNKIYTGNDWTDSDLLDSLKSISN